MVYLDRPSYAPTVLGARIVVKDCSYIDAEKGGSKARKATPLSVCETSEADHKFLSAMKSAAIEYLQQNTEQYLYRADRNILTKQVIQVCRQFYFPCVRASFEAHLRRLLHPPPPQPQPTALPRSPLALCCMSTSVVVCNLRISRSWEQNFCVTWWRRHGWGWEAQGQKHHLWAEGQLSHSHLATFFSPVAWIRQHRQFVSKHPNHFGHPDVFLLIQK